MIFNTAISNIYLNSTFDSTLDFANGIKTSDKLMGLKIGTITATFQSPYYGFPFEVVSTTSPGLKNKATAADMAKYAKESGKIKVSFFWKTCVIVNNDGILHVVE
ncbi:hypothetical protein FBU30_000320 [Linnemannia zychae]|nr:hypothetical protein FBU30_000320 [Linnemannia zychae]